MTACGAQLAAFANGDVFIFFDGGHGLVANGYIHLQLRTFDDSGRVSAHCGAKYVTPCHIYVLLM